MKTLLWNVTLSRTYLAGTFLRTITIPALSEASAARKGLYILGEIPGHIVSVVPLNQCELCGEPGEECRDCEDEAAFDRHCEREVF